jgi:hydroxymethylpyrimidine kinase/phosphomethylpyrimidine kinase
MRRHPTALSIGGLDPGGGAGIAADLRSFHAVGAFGAAVVAVVTVQSTDGLRSVTPLSPRLVLAQAREVVRAENVRAIKLGALGAGPHVRAIASWLRRVPGVPVVLDPVILPTRGKAHLLSKSAVLAVRNHLLPRATLVTANAVEASLLTGLSVTTVDDAREAARALVELGAHAALVKGGHLEAGREVVDVLVRRGGAEVLYRSARKKLPPLHGGGCVLASLIAGLWALRPLDVSEVNEIVREARRLHQQALSRPLDIGGAMRVLDPGHRPRLSMGRTFRLGDTVSPPEDSES